MDGCRVVQVEEVAHKIDIVVTATGNKKVITRDHMDKMKSGTILANMGHANTEIDILSLKSSEIIWEKVILRTYIQWLPIENQQSPNYVVNSQFSRRPDGCYAHITLPS